MLDNLTPRKVVLLAMTLMLMVVLFGAVRQVPDLLAAHFSNPDSYYKLVLLRDYTPQGGLQYMARDNAPLGSYVHWSAVHSWVMQQMARGFGFLGLAAEPALVWAGGSLTLLSVLLLALCVVWTVVNQGGRLAALIAALVLATSRPLFAYGQLLQITHHIFMLVPLAGAACCLLRERLDLRPMAHGTLDLLGGGLIGLALWTSPETMPLVVALAAIRAALRLQVPQAGPVWPVALGLMAVLVSGWLLDPPPPTFSAWALDHISLAWLLLGLALTSLLLLTDWLTARRVGICYAVTILAAAFVLAAVLWLLVVPGAHLGITALIPPDLQSLWWHNINEMRRPSKPWEIVSWLAMPTLAGALLLGIAWREHSLWRALLALTTLAYTVQAFLHMRSGAAAALLAALAYGITLVSIRGFAARRPTLEMAGRRQWPAILLVLAPAVQLVLWVGLVVWLGNAANSQNNVAGNHVIASVSDDTSTSNHADACSIRTIVSRLNALPAGIVLAPLDETGEILWRTHQRTVAGGYHHNIGGLRDYFHIWNSTAPDALAQSILARRGVDYLLACQPPTAPEKESGATPTLLTRAAEGADIPWLPHHETIGRWHLYFR